MNLWLIIAVMHTGVKLKPEKNSGLNWIQTHDLHNTGAVLYQLSYQAIWGRGFDLYNTGEVLYQLSYQAIWGRVGSHFQALISQLLKLCA